MEMSGAIGGGAPAKEEEEEALCPAADAGTDGGREAETKPPPERRRCGRQALLVAGLVTLPLLLFLVVGQESAATVWEMASAKLTAFNGRAGGFMNPAASRAHGGGGGGSSAAGTGAENNNNNNNEAADELLGGLLAPGADRASCRSRYDISRYYKHFPHAPSPHLVRRLRAYEARHRRCAPGTPLYAEALDRLRSGNGNSTSDEQQERCRYVVWLPFDGLGNRMLSMVSGFLYALLTDRVLLAALPPDSDDLFCEPFPNTTWRLPVSDDFPVANLFGMGPFPAQSYTALLNANKIGNATTTSPPPYVYLSLGWQLADKLFFCGEHQRALAPVGWLLLYSDLYFAPSLYGVAEFQDELRRMFPAKESVAHLLVRYLLHPSNSVWGLVTRYYRAYLAPAGRRIGLQIRMYGHSSIPVDDMYDQILRCSRQERILPETDDDDQPPALAPAVEDVNDTTGTTTTINSNNTNTTAILIASLYADYYERLRSRYYERAAGGAAVGVFQPTHEERQATSSPAHNRKALAEIYLLGLSEELLTSGLSTFGYVASSLAGVRPTILMTAFQHRVPATPCRRARSMEPCNLTPPLGRHAVECRGKGVDQDDLARHLRVCEDWKEGVKFFD